jgi:hypothetical protein
VDAFADMYPALTPYHYAANNPLKFIDINGDSLDTAGDQALSYLHSLVNEETADRITTDSKGRASFNTEGLDMDNADAAVKLLNKVINGSGKFLFEVVAKGNTTSGVLRNTTSKGAAGDNVPIDVNTGDGIANLSITPRNINGGIGGAGLLPKNGYGGQVSLGLGSWNYMNGAPQPTSNIVFHELAECYQRTVNQEPYMRSDGSGAHQRAIIDANNFKKQVGQAGWGIYVPK